MSALQKDALPHQKEFSQGFPLLQASLAHSKQKVANKHIECPQHIQIIQPTKNKNSWLFIPAVKISNLKIETKSTWDESGVTFLPTQAWKPETLAWESGFPPTSWVGTQHPRAAASQHSHLVLFPGNRPAVFNKESKGQFPEDIHECPQMWFQLCRRKRIPGRKLIVFFRFSKLSMPPPPTKVKHHQNRWIQLPFPHRLMYRVYQENRVNTLGGNAWGVALWGEG